MLDNIVDVLTNAKRKFLNTIGGALQVDIDNRYAGNIAAASDALENTVVVTMSNQYRFSGFVFDKVSNDVTLEIGLADGVWSATDDYFVDLGSPVDIQGASPITSYKGFAIVNTTAGGVGPFLVVTPCHHLRLKNAAAAAGAVTYSQLNKSLI